MPAPRRESEISHSGESRYKVIDGLNELLRFNLENLVKSDNTVAADQIIHYPPKSNDSRYTFSLWAFPEENYGQILTAHFKFAPRVFRSHRVPQQHAVRGVPDCQGSKQSCSPIRTTATS